MQQQLRQTCTHHTCQTHKRTLGPRGSITTDECCLHLQVLKASGSEDPKYPHPFELQVKVTLGDNSLQQELAVTNTGAAPHAHACDISWLGLQDVGLRQDSIPQAPPLCVQQSHAGAPDSISTMYPRKSPSSPCSFSAQRISSPQQLHQVLFRTLRKSWCAVRQRVKLADCLPLQASTVTVCSCLAIC